MIRRDVDDDLVTFPDEQHAGDEEGGTWKHAEGLYT